MWEITDGENYFEQCYCFQLVLNDDEIKLLVVTQAVRISSMEEPLGRDVREKIKVQQDSARWCVQSGLYFIVLTYQKLNIAQTKVDCKKTVCVICSFCCKTLEIPLFLYLLILVRIDLM